MRQKLLNQDLVHCTNILEQYPKRKNTVIEFLREMGSVNGYIYVSFSIESGVYKYFKAWRETDAETLELFSELKSWLKNKS